MEGLSTKELIGWVRLSRKPSNISKEIKEEGKDLSRVGNFDAARKMKEK